MKVTLPGDASGLTLYAQIYNEAGEVCIQSSLLFEAVVDANWATYDFAMVEAGTASMIYQFDFPVIPAGVYGIAVYLQAGGSPAVTDAPRVGTGVIDWGGTAELSLSAVPWNAAWDAEVESEAADALVAYNPPTRAEATADKDEILLGVGAVDTVVDAILIDTDITIPALIAALNDFDPLADPVEVGSLLQAALAQFVTDDTGEIAAANGSVGFLAQGAASIGSSGSEAVPTFEWTLNGVHEVDFVLTSNAGVEMTGLGGTFTFEIRKAGGVFVAGVGTKAEIGSGWYRYLNDPSESDTIGPVAMRAIGAGTVQQNLLATVETLQIGSLEFAYTVTNTTTGLPEPGVTVWITTDIAGNNIIVNNLLTDAFGVARNSVGSLPRLDTGSYYFWKRKIGTVDNDAPDLEVVSP